MTSNAQRLLADALQLSDDDRAELAGRLIESLDSNFDAEAAADWDREIGRRIEELDRGEVVDVPWEEACRLIQGARDEPTDEISTPS